MTGSLPYFKLYTSDFLSATQMMSNEEVGAYIRLLAEGYDRDQPLPYDPERLRRLLGIFRTRDAKKLVDRLIAMGKFKVGKDGCLHNGRAEQEMEIRRKSKANQPRFKGKSTANGAQMPLDLPSNFPETPMKSTGDEAHALVRARASATRVPEPELEGKGSAPHRAESPSPATGTALPPREAVAPGLGGRAPAAPDAEAHPADVLTAEQKAEMQRRWDALKAGLTTGSTFDGTAPPSRLKAKMQEAQHETAKTAGRAEPAGDRAGEGAVPSPAGAVAGDASPAAVDADARGTGPGPPRHGAAERQAKAEDATSIYAALKREEKP